MFFNSSEFFSAVDLRFCTFCQGVKAFRGKKQISNLLEAYTLSKCNPVTIMKLRQEKIAAQEEKYCSNPIKEIKDLPNEILFSFNELQNMLDEYSFWRNEIVQFRENVLSEYDMEGRRLAPFVRILLSRQWKD